MTQHQVEWKNESALIRIPLKRKKGWEHYVLLQSDRHWDNPGADLAMITDHLDQAKERGATVVDCGDFYCAMQGKWDPRSNKADLRPEHQVGHYLDALVETGFEFLKPYAANIAFMSPGNHEGSIKDRRETDLTERTVTLLRAAGSPVIKHKYSGFTRFQFQDGRYQESKVMWHTHGYGGGGPVTKDVIQTNRQGVFLEGTDIVVSGHTHDAWVFPVATRGINKHGQIVANERLHVKIPSTKDKWGKNSWEDLKGMPPKPQGTYWLKFWWSARHEKVIVDAERAH